MAKNRPPIKFKINEIVDYWAANVDEQDLSIDFSEAHERCWRCGYKTSLHICHIVPHSLGGQDLPENLVLLCRMCHSECPNINDKEFFWDWLKAHKVHFYDTYWVARGMREYEYIYKQSVIDDLAKLGITRIDQIRKILFLHMEKATWHWGQPRMNPATIAGVFRLMIRNLRKEIDSKVI